MANKEPIVISSFDGNYQLTGFPLQRGSHKGFFITQIKIKDDINDLNGRGRMRGFVISTTTRDIYHTFSGWRISDRMTPLAENIYEATTNLESELTTYLGDFDPNTLQAWFVSTASNITTIESIIVNPTIDYSKVLDKSLLTDLL